MLDLRDTMATGDIDKVPERTMTPIDALNKIQDSFWEKVIHLASSNLSFLSSVVKQSPATNEELQPMKMDSNDKDKWLSAVPAWRFQCYEFLFDQLQEEYDDQKSKMSEWKRNWDVPPTQYPPL